ncbi:class I SAM-dependent methyltransferase [Candidatus Dojkabacteria bacterium]|nr:class I SAM-dependent methyltransferase [Candidatus Dojkabacteria bacterium]
MHSKWTSFFNEHGRFYILPHQDFKDVINYFKEQEVYNIIDIGCGTGRHLVQLAQEGFNVTGIDFSPAAGQIAEKWLEEKDLKGKVYVADFREELVNFKTDEFDAGVAVNTLQYIESPDQIEGIFSEINRIVKTEGPIFIVLPSDMSLIIQPDVMQVFFDKDTLEPIVDKYFDVIDLYKDKEKCWVIMGKNRDNVKETELVEKEAETEELVAEES